MRRNDKLLQTVFNDIVGSENKLSLIDQFLDVDENLGIQETDDIKRYKFLYRQIVDKISEDIKNLAQIEEMITQLRCFELIPQELKFIKVRRFVYARAVFYKSDAEKKEIRVYVDDTTEYDKTYEELIQIPEFITLAQNKLRDAMIGNIASTKLPVNVLEEIYN